MSIEFVDPDPAPPAVAATPAARPSALPARLLGVAAVVAAVVVALSALTAFYAVRRTISVPDFDGIHTTAVEQWYDAFGRADAARNVTPGSASGAYSSALSIRVEDSVSYGWWWYGIGAALLLLGLWALVRPRSDLATLRTVGVAAAGTALLASVGTAWLGIRAVDATSVPGVAVAAGTRPGLWLLVAGGALAVLGGILAATHARWSRLRRRRVRLEHRDVQLSGPDPA